MLQEDKSRVEIFKEWLHCQHDNITSPWLKDQLRMPNNDYIQSVARCLQMMLRINEYKLAFVAIDGISTIVTVLAGRVNFQIQYQLTFCLWVLTFNVDLAKRNEQVRPFSLYTRFGDVVVFIAVFRYNIIPILADILSESGKEKVARIILATFRNLIEKPDENEIKRDNAIAMVQCKVSRTA
ncbi:hypothetical protein MRX96_030105 [Rhipicephalus microplus]